MQSATTFQEGCQLLLGRVAQALDPAQIQMRDLVERARGVQNLLHGRARQRIAELPAPTGLQRGTSPSKQNDLPVGISGPILRHRPGRSVPECHFSVNLPRFAAKPLRRSVYIANQNTYTPERYRLALESAIRMRREAEEQYQLDATTAKRKAAGAL